MSYAREAIRRADVELVLHHWLPPAPRAVIYYVHGTQSHAGWMFETGPALAGHGCAVYALDRRGSGLSGGPRGDTPSFAHWRDDYLDVLVDVRARHTGLPLLLLGQSMGGAIASSVACDPRAPHDALLLVAPLLVPSASKLWAGKPEAEPVPLPLPDDWYTRDPRYLAFMRDDTLMARALTPRFQAARAAMAEHTFSLEAPLAKRPSALILPRQDRIIDLAQAREVFGYMTGQGGTIIDLPAEDHYLEFTAYRHLLWHLEAALATYVHS
jgi:alpha-beta hydrolase superfamily lysophospholipase